MTGPPCGELGRGDGPTQVVVDAVEPAEARGGDPLEHQPVVGDGRVDLAQRPGRRDSLGRGIDALEPLATRHHRLPDPPQVVKGQRAVLAAAVIVDPGAVAHLEVTVAHLAPAAQDGPHLLDRGGVLACDLAPVIVRAFTGHDDAKERELGHRPDGEPAAPVEELATLVGQHRPVFERVVRDPAVEREVLRARDHDERIELEILHRPHRIAAALEAAPAPPRPETAATHDVATGGDRRDLQHPVD